MDISDYFATYTVRTDSLETPGFRYSGPSVAINDTIVIGEGPLNTARVTFNDDRHFDFRWCEDSRTLYYEHRVEFTPIGGTQESGPARCQLSLAIDGQYKMIYAGTYVGDPQQVGVWGADTGG